MTLGERLRQARIDKGMTQNQIAEPLGKRPKDILRYERDKQVPNAITFGEICHIMNVSADAILGLDIKSE